MKRRTQSQKVFAEHPLTGAVRRSLQPARLSRTARGLLGVGLLGLAACGTVQADFPAVIEPADLNGSNGFALNGAATSVSNAGDVNGDGVDDLVIGAGGGDPNGTFSGQSYVVFGGPGVGSGGALELSALDGTNGFALNGINAFDRSGESVSSAGDINDDGVDDLVIGAPQADPNGLSDAGQSYVVFGGPSVGSGGVLELSALDGRNGFALNGINSYFDHSGRSVSGAGDVNGDGIADLIIGAPGSYYDYLRSHSYVVFGDSSVGSSGTLELAALDGRNGFAINGINAYDYTGYSVSGAGDVNGDGIDDIIIGAYWADPNGDRSGQSYVVFGGPGIGSGGALELSALDGRNGFALNGINDGDESGWSVSGAGDVNGDGIDDLIIGAPPAPCCTLGQSYVVFGGAGVGSGGVLELSALNGTNGFALTGINGGDKSGSSVSGAGDVNGDGIDDLVIGAPWADPNSEWSGQSYVVFGGPSIGSGGALELSALDGGNGFALNGIYKWQHSGKSVSSAGDVNADGVDDVIIGGDLQSYVVFGRASDSGPRRSSFPALHALGDTNGDDTPEIAVVFRRDGKTIAKVKDAANGDLISRFTFSADLPPVDVEAIDGFGLAPSLVLLGQGPATGPTAETRDALSGDLIGRVAFKPGFAPVDLTVLPDEDGNGIPEVGMLGKGSTKVEILDAVTGEAVNNLGFAPRFEPKQVITLPDLNGNGSAEVGAVLTKADETDRVVILDSLTDEKINTVAAWWYVDYDLLQALAVPDADGNPTGKVALLLHEAASGKTLVRITDAATDAIQATLRGYNPDFDPMKLAVLGDMNGNGAEEYAVLARNPDTGQVHAKVRDGVSAEAINTVWFDKACTPFDMVSIADINANGAEELVLLERCADGALKAVVKDAGTGETLNRLRF